MLGAALHEHRMQSMAGQAASPESEESEGPPADQEAVTAQQVPAPGAQDPTAREPPHKP